MCVCGPTRLHDGWSKARFPFKRNRLRWQAANHGCHCFDRTFPLAGACVCCVKLAFLAVFVYATHAIAFEWKPGLTAGWQAVVFAGISSHVTNAVYHDDNGRTATTRRIITASRCRHCVDRPAAAEAATPTLLLSAVPRPSHCSAAVWFTLR